MTDPAGVCFISYKRERSGEVSKVVAAMHEVGIPTWQDVSDLGSSVTEHALERALADARTSSALMFVTPEVASSDMIRRVEVPAIFARVRKADRFFALPVAAGGLDYGEVATALGPRTGLVDVSSWNIMKVSGDPIDAGEATRIAARALDLRLAEIHGSLPQDVPARVRVLTRPGVACPDDTLTIDLRHLFVSRHATQDSWRDVVLPALDAVAAALRRHMPGRRVELCGNLSLPTALALGVAMPSLGGIDASWLQEQVKFGEPVERWSLGITQSNSGFAADTYSRSVTGSDLALLVSATNDVSDDFATSSAALPLRGLVHVHPGLPRPARVQLDAAAATQLACLCVDSLRSAATRFGVRGPVHLFLAVPAGVAFMIGQQLNTFGQVMTYEHDPIADPPYVAAATLLPSN